MSFQSLKQAVQGQFDTFPAQQLFYKEIDRDKIWDIYLESFLPAVRQEYTCNSCKSFLRQWGGLVCIVGAEVRSIWDLDTNIIDIEFIPAVLALRAYISTLPITDVFLTDTTKCGTDKNRDSVKDIYWEHLFLNMQVVPTMSRDNIPAKLGEYRTAKEVFKRGLDELKLDAIDTALELMAQNSLYRGKEFENMLVAFSKARKEYDELSTEGKELYCWLASARGIAYGIRNTAIGTLLVNLSEGMDLDQAVGKYEAIMAPANYKRPTALVTPKMIEQAKEQIQELGYMDSLDRRFAVTTDISVNDLLFTDRSSELKDVFDQMKEEALVNPRTLSKVEEIGIDDFLTSVLPAAKEIEVLLEPSHLPNLVSLLTAVHPDAPVLFKWPNPFSWTYTGGVADSIKERVKAAGGNVEGVLRFSIQWNDEDTKSIVDFDAHAHEPSGDHIAYNSGFRKDSGDRRTRMSGQLDVDMINPSGIGVENISWTNIHQMKEGKYIFKIHNFNGNRTTGFKAQIEMAGEIHDFFYPSHVTGFMDVAEVTLKDGKFTMKSLLTSSSKVASTQKWGVATHQFTKVKSIMLSPNHWGSATGNKHYLFILEGCLSDELTRPFLNEQLKPELETHRKVFEMLGSKLMISPPSEQLSGVGFSETIPNQLIVRVTGAFKRNLKIKF